MAYSEYDTKLLSLLETKTEIEENSEYEVEIRASMLVVINYIYEQINKSIDRIDIKTIAKYLRKKIVYIVFLFHIKIY